jgi:hypothetical protein
MVAGRPYVSSIDGRKYVTLLFIPFTGMKTENTHMSTVDDGRSLLIEYKWPTFMFATNFMPAVRLQHGQREDYDANFAYQTGVRDLRGLENRDVVSTMLYPIPIPCRDPYVIQFIEYAEHKVLLVLLEAIGQPAVAAMVHHIQLAPTAPQQPRSYQQQFQQQQQQQYQQQQQQQQYQQQQQPPPPPPPPPAPPQYATRSPLSHLRQQQPVPPQWGMPLPLPRVSQNSQGVKAPKPVNHQHHNHASLQKVNRRLIDEDEENPFSKDWRYKESDWDDEDEQEEPEEEQHLSPSYTSRSQDKRSRHS